jgi:hypothetical protein
MNNWVESKRMIHTRKKVNVILKSTISQNEQLEYRQNENSMDSEERATECS